MIIPVTIKTNVLNILVVMGGGDFNKNFISKTPFNALHFLLQKTLKSQRNLFVALKLCCYICCLFWTK